MKKIISTILASVLMFIANIHAQTVQDGINFLYEDREQSAKSVFEKLLAVNPNNIDATYWLGQAYISLNDTVGARQVYNKALAASANAPLLIVGMGHVELLENKINDARQRFETAITMTHTKKGDDPVILNAIGRANVDAKAGDLAYAIEKLEAATQRDSKNADIFLNLGNAYRKARPGEGGGQAYTNYKKALEVNPNFAIANYRIATLFETQKNWDLFLDNLNQAVTKDPGFGPAYYDLYYYYLLKVDPASGKIDFATADDYAKKFIANTDPDIQNDYLRAQTLWAQKNYDEAIGIAKGIVSKAGDQTKPRTYKLLAYCFVEKGDTVQAKNYIDEYFVKAKPEEIIPLDYLLKANIYSGIGDNPDAVVKTFIEAANADTTIAGKINLLKRGADLMKTKGDRLQEAGLRELIFKTNPTPGNLDIFNWGLALYFDSAYAKADSVFGVYSAKYPDQTFGWQWQFNSERQIDTSMEKGLAVPTAMKYLELLAKDSLKNKPNILIVAGYLATYYANIAKDAAKALEYINQMLALDPDNANLKDVHDQLEKSLKKQPPNQKNTNGGNTANRAAINGNK
ncbi:MAG TPA: tetratricopeptide repeat protein [Chitinophagaceae bacterium]|nr:tetratricopeptide repeat protein [Chitinophagaceae bacterium]